MTNRFAALLVSLFLLSLTMLFGPLLLIGCDQGPLMKCDYCRTARYGVQRYICDKCKKPHAACDSEKCILNYTKTEGLRGTIYYSATSILTCPGDPSPSDPEVTITPLEPATEHPFLPKLTLWQQILAAVIVIGIFFIGYARGRRDRQPIHMYQNGKRIA